MPFFFKLMVVIWNGWHYRNWSDI